MYISSPEQDVNILPPENGDILIDIKVSGHLISGNTPGHTLAAPIAFGYSNVGYARTNFAFMTSNLI